MKKTYLLVYLGLLALLAATLGGSWVDLGPANVVLALGVAAVKALLIILYFMHVKHGPRLTWVFVGAGFFWFAILVVLTMGDYLTRTCNPAAP